MIFRSYPLLELKHETFAQLQSQKCLYKWLFQLFYENSYMFYFSQFDNFYRVDHEFMDGYKAVLIKDQTWQLKKC